MTDQPGAKRSLRQMGGGTLYSLIFQPGWPRWVLLAVAALVFILVALALSGGTSYRDDPSVLVPRSSQVYMETRDLDSLLRTVAAWKVWKPERRAKGDEQRNQLQVDIASLIGDQVAGLGTRLPLLWLIEAKQAAYCINQDDQGQESWALILRADDSAEVMADIGVEPGMQVETVKGNADQGVFKLTGTGAGELYFGVVKPWLIISSQSTLPEFALESTRRPAFSMSRSGLLPNWRRGVVVRGVTNPVYRAERANSPAYGILTNWMDPDVRVNFTSKIGSKGLETTFDADQLSERVRGGGLWPLFAVLLVIIGLVALAIVFAVILAMVGWGGWLKTAAMRAGVTPAKAPRPTEPSAAFIEDSGAAKAAAGSSADAPSDTKNAPASTEQQEIKPDRAEPEQNVEKNENSSPVPPEESEVFSESKDNGTAVAPEAQIHETEEKLSDSGTNSEVNRKRQMDRTTIENDTNNSNE